MPSYGEQVMSKGRGEWRAAFWGAGFGVVGGLALVCLHYLYEQLTRPHPYNVLTFLSAPVFMIFGAIVGLLAAAWHSSD
jgi:hypothetical protein